MADKNALLGTWKMVSWTREVVATGEISDALGPNPIGYISYQPDGHVMALVVRGDRAPLAGPAPTDEEKILLFNGMLAYAGTYTLDRDKVVHHIDGLESGVGGNGPGSPVSAGRRHPHD